MKIVRIIIGLLLLPCCAAVSRAIYFMLTAPGHAGQAVETTFWLALGAGFVLWGLLFAFLPSPVKSYVLAHELTHALWGSMLGASVLSMRVSKTGGSVKLSESNFIVALAPYFFPLYTMVVICAYFLSSVFFDLRGYYLLFIAVVGFTLGFHIFFTISVLGQKQKDIGCYGRFFSYTLIYLMNVLIIGLVIVAVAPVSLSQFMARLAVDLTFVWGYVGKLVLNGVAALKTLLWQNR